MNIIRYSFMTRFLVLLMSITGFSIQSRATHVMGGDLTWTCQGGDYVFQLVFYRDCNGADVNPISENIKVWNHPSLTQFTVDFVSRTDVSPICTEVSGGPVALTCGTGANGGNGLGAIEKVVYRSVPITISGTPPAEGWVFTYDTFSRNGSITNLQNPTDYGITITAKVFAIPNSTGGCVDNSPQFLQEPYFVSCTGEPYEYNMNPVDQDLDSLVILFGTPLDFLDGQAYNPPSVPAAIPYEPGFSVNSPTPDASMNPGNIAAQVDPISGNLTFLSNNAGNYVVKVVAESYRQGTLIAMVEREIQLIVLNCSGTNTTPIVTGPFAGSFETTVNAGDLVTFTLNSTDLELLQDGSPQSNLLTATGLMFSSNYTSGTGCINPPCANLDSAPTITGVQGVGTNFSWQTDCSHLLNPDGYAADMIPFHFVFKIQDDYCPVPKVRYATITVNVENLAVIQAPQINCIQTDATGDLTINWNSVSDPDGTFVEYEVHSVQSGLIGTIPTIATNSYTVPGGGASSEDYFLAVVSGCAGNATRYSDTIANIFLDVNNPTNGTAVLQWNDPTSSLQTGMNDYYHIYREYPVGVWSLYDSVPFGVHNYIDTIDICSADLNYQIVLEDQTCAHTSNIDGDLFEDMLTPDIPIIEFASIDTLTGFVTISWNENAQEDTYGYVIYQVNSAGIPVEIDTVWGLTNTSYVHNTNTTGGPLSYTVAAFDSCWTVSVPPTYQTSAKAEVHTTMFLSGSINICEKTVDLSWTPYVGWDALSSYTIYGYEEGQPWSVLGTSTQPSFTASVQEARNYCYVVEANHANGQTSFSTIACFYVPIPGQPSFNYLKVASVTKDSIHLKYYVDNSAYIPEVSLKRSIDGLNYIEITKLPVTGTDLEYYDSEVDVYNESYTYRVQIIDSCGNPGAYSNRAKSILLNVQTGDVERINYLSWNPYSEFDGSILAYRIYRGLSGQPANTFIGTVPNGFYSYEDDVNNVISNGQICYRVEAVESMNVYSFSETASSNEACALLEPIIYIPNSFTPNDDEHNPVFLPILSDFDASDFQLLIFNRWGKQIFETNQYDEGWDGTIALSGKLAPVGTYLYVVTVKDGEGNEIVKRGHVNLVK